MAKASLKEQAALPFCSPKDEARLRAAGFMPVVRWVDVEARSDMPLKTIEALTLLDRREESLRKKMLAG